MVDKRDSMGSVKIELHRVVSAMASNFVVIREWLM